MSGEVQVIIFIEKSSRLQRKQYHGKQECMKFGLEKEKSNL